jgi:hypothetical protein
MNVCCIQTLRNAITLAEKDGADTHMYADVGMTCLLKTNTSKSQIYLRG